ncbi:hypothetical protein CKO24_08385 [Rhodothalassium salexigens DSM 2132]|nr:hypothetical protein [Rhodothalassium salexigens DSM 2132]
MGRRQSVPVSMDQRPGIGIAMPDKRYSTRLWLALALTLIVLVLFWPQRAFVTLLDVQADAGQLDLAALGWRGDTLVALDGEWRKIDDAIVAPERLAPDRADRPGTPHNVPDVWGPTFTDRLDSGHGQATYALDLTLPKAAGALALTVPRIRSIARVYAVSTGPSGAPEVHLLGSNGDPTATALSPRGPPPLASILFLPSDKRRVTLVIQVANHVHKQGGIIATPMIGDVAMINRNTAIQDGQVVAITLILVIMAFAAVGAGMTQPSPASYYLFALMSLAAAARVLLTSDQVWDYAPSLNLSRKYDLEYLSFFVLLSAFYGFIAAMFPHERLRWASWFVLGLSAVWIGLVVAVTPFLAPAWITLWREPYEVFAFTVLGLMATILVRAVRHDRPYARIALLCVGLAVLTGLCVSAYFHHSLPASMDMAQLLILVIGAIYGIGVVERFTLMQKERDALTRDLCHRNSELQQAKAAAEQASRSKSQFLATVSHELRTPLNAILGFTDLMRQQIHGPINPPSYAGYVEDVHKSGKHLLSVINAVLDMAKIEAGRLELDAERLNLDDAVTSAVRMMLETAKRRQIQVVTEIDDDLPDVHADPRLVRQIVLNLVSNAVKFSQPGGRVAVRVARNDDGSVDLTVADDGIGMTQADLKRVLEPFAQVAHIQRRQSGHGTGLGLPLVKSMAEAHGASFDLDSIPDQGTTARVRFPAGRVLAAEATPMVTVTAP